MGINSKLDVTGGEVHTYGAQYKTAVDAVKPARSDLRVIMDRNLGATGALYSLSTTNAQNYPTYGLLYQWGRKDPFPKAAAGSTSVNQTTYKANGSTATGFPTSAAGPITMNVAIQNPEKFYYYNSSPYDWISSRNNALWGDGTTKSVYDPCPEGWRVAPNGTWNDFGSDWGSSFVKNPNWTAANIEIGGGLYSAGTVNAFYPVPGYRHRESGLLSSIGNGGFVWSSTTPTNSEDNYRIYYLDFRPNMVDANATSNRADANLVRCIQE